MTTISSISGYAHLIFYARKKIIREGRENVSNNTFFVVYFIKISHTHTHNLCKCKKYYFEVLFFFLALGKSFV